MRFPPQFLDELRARLPVSDVVGRRVKLKKRGREWVGLSPFNQEKTPSFTVNDQKGFFHDFSSGKHGNIFDFVMETEGVTFPEAVERLASLAGVPVPKLSKEAEAREARGYLADRGIEPAAQLKFRLGYAGAERYALKEHLGAHRVPVPDMIEAGLLIAGEDIAVPFDRFRDRVMFPITDWRGRVIAFGGRAMEKEAQAKYLNSPETPLFHKGSTLYNGASARSAAHQGATVVAVEGYIDVIAMVAAGYEATVAPLGTALTEDQLALLWRMSDEPVLCFDGDKAGTRAAYRAIDLALPQLKPGKSLKFAILPEGQDPDDLFRSGGRAAIEDVILGARPLSDLLWLRETEAGSFDTPERRAALERRIAEVTATIGDEAVRRYYRQDLEARLQRLLAPPSAPDRNRGLTRDSSRRGKDWRSRSRSGQPGFREISGPRSARFATSPIVRGFRTGLPPREALILLAVVNHPWLLEAHAEELAEIELRHSDADRLRRAVLDIIGASVHDSDTMRAALAALDLGGVLARVEKAITHGSDWPARSGAPPEDVAAFWTHVLTLHRRTRTLHKELKSAEQALGSEPNEENFLWLRDVQERLAAVEGTEALIEGFGASSGRPARSF